MLLSVAYEKKPFLSLSASIMNMGALTILGTVQDGVSKQPEGFADTAFSTGIFAFPGTRETDQLKELHAPTKRRIGNFVPLPLDSIPFWTQKHAFTVQRLFW